MPSYLLVDSETHNPSPTFTTVTLMHSPNDRRSHQIMLTPQALASPLPTLQVRNLPGTSRHNSPSPVVSALFLTTLTVDPLVAEGTDFSSPKVQYDLSKGSHTARINTCAIGSLISDEQKDFPVVQGALPLQNTSLHIVFDHPVLTSFIECDPSLTIGDLIQALHMHFHHRLGSRETSNVGQDMNLYTAAVVNQHKRCQALLDPDMEWKKGMKRIDVLGKDCKFRGVALDAATSTLTLHVVLGR